MESVELETILIVGSCVRQPGPPSAATFAVAATVRPKLNPNRGSGRQREFPFLTPTVPGVTVPPARPTTVDTQTGVLRPSAAEYAAAQGGTITWWRAFHGIVALEVNHHLDWREAEEICLRHLSDRIRELLLPATSHSDHSRINGAASVLTYNT